MNQVTFRAGILAFAMGIGMFHDAAMAADKVSVRLNWIPGSEHGYFYLAKQKGWYADAGIDLDIIPGEGSTLVVKTVGNGDNDFGVADVATIARGWEVGVPLVALAVILKESPASIYSRKSAGITSMKDLCGKRVGINIKSTTTAQYYAMLRQADLKDCKIEEVPMSAGGVKEVLSGTVDAAVTFAYEDPVMIEAQGIEVNRIIASDFFKLYSLTLVTNQKLTETKPKLVSNFVSVTMRALKYSITHPEEAVAAFVKVSPEANLSYERPKLALFNSLILAGDKSGASVGQQDAKGWDASLDTLYKIGIVKKQMDSAGKFLQISQ